MPITPFTVKNGLTVGSTSVIGSNAKLHTNNAITSGTIFNYHIADSATPTGTFGSSSQIPVITVDSKGFITNISNTNVSGVSSVAFTTANNNLRISTTDGGTYDATINTLPVLGYINTTIEGSTIVSSETYDAGSVTQSDKDAFGAYISGDILDCMEPSGQVITADCGALT